MELAAGVVDCVSLYIAAEFDYSSTWQKEKETLCSNGTGNAKSQPACLTTSLPTSSNLNVSGIQTAEKEQTTEDRLQE